MLVLNELHFAKNVKLGLRDVGLSFTDANIVLCLSRQYFALGPICSKRNFAHLPANNS